VSEAFRCYFFALLPSTAPYDPPLPRRNSLREAGQPICVFAPPALRRVRLARGSVE